MYHELDRMEIRFVRLIFHQAEKLLWQIFQSGLPLRGTHFKKPSLSEILIHLIIFLFNVPLPKRLGC